MERRTTYTRDRLGSSAQVLHTLATATGDSFDALTTATGYRIDSLTSSAGGVLCALTHGLGDSTDIV